MQLFKVSNIKWDEAPNDELPTGAYVYADDRDDIADALSDEFGWCITTLDCEVVTDSLVFPIGDE